MTDSATAVSASPRRASAGGSSPRAGTKARRRRRTLVAYLFLAPFLVLFGGFVLAPAVYGLWISFTDWSPFRDVQHFIGLQNYADLFTPGSTTSADFWGSMKATAIFVVASVPFLVVVPLLVAVLLNQKLRAASTFRTIFFAPYVLGVAVVGLIWGYVLDTQSGILNHLLNAVGIRGDIPWTVDVPWAWVSLVGVTVWWTSGLNTVIFLAGLKGINSELYEAASLDGAGPFRSFTNVTLPGLRPVMLFITTTTVLASANMFGQSYLLTTGGPGNETRTVIMYIADQGLSQNNMAPAAAMSYVLFAFLAVVSIVNFRLQRERVEKRRTR
ncbi:carbohydrate ABC transporter permease [Cellulomonas sp. PhB150]|uniref:carbohydrate ABC transporter permease n=1 Tax=Cellulomonas sp. PhB150 TaxID=2485188 RepID=UPI000F4A7531|nr:sugar ABC transporter permease [Cellulomonas sp. PhB150]ROS30769.1 multiple sugar transport system permease protein [Cellulomonas sp. PhB150]